MQFILDSLSQDYRKVFVMDGLGAIVSACCLLFIIPNLGELINIPKDTLYILGSLPILFLIVDVLAYVMYPNKRQFFLMAIILLNFMYCLLSIFMTIQHLDLITFIWLGYVIVEIIILIIVIYVEWKVYKECLS